MLKRGIKVHGVVVATAFLVDMQHSRSSQVTDDSLNLAAGKGHRLGEVVDGAALACGDAEEHGTVTGDVIPVVPSHDDCVMKCDPGLCRRWRGDEAWSALTNRYGGQCRADSELAPARGQRVNALASPLRRPGWRCPPPAGSVRGQECEPDLPVAQFPSVHGANETEVSVAIVHLAQP